MAAILAALGRIHGQKDVPSPLLPASSIVLVDLWPLVKQRVAAMPAEQYVRRGSVCALIDGCCADLRRLCQDARTRVLVIAFDIPSRVPVPRRQQHGHDDDDDTAHFVDLRLPAHASDGVFQISDDANSRLQAWPDAPRSVVWAHVVLAWQLHRALTHGLLDRLVKSGKERGGESTWPPPHVGILNGLYLKNASEHAKLRTLIVDKDAAAQTSPLWLALRVAYEVSERNAFDIWIDTHTAAVQSERLFHATTECGDAIVRLLGALMPMPPTDVVLVLVSSRPHAESLALAALETWHAAPPRLVWVQQQSPPVDLTWLWQMLGARTREIFKDLSWPALRFLLTVAGHFGSAADVATPPLTDTIDALLVACRLLLMSNGAGVRVPSGIAYDPRQLIIAQPPDNTTVWRPEIALVAAACMVHLRDHRNVQLPITVPVVDCTPCTGAVMRAAWLGDYEALAPVHATHYQHLAALSVGETLDRTRTLCGWRRDLSPSITATDAVLMARACRVADGQQLVEGGGGSYRLASVRAATDAETALPPCLHRTPLDALAD